VIFPFDGSGNHLGRLVGLVETREVDCHLRQAQVTVEKPPLPLLEKEGKENKNGTAS
jgi:hypothetical protein